MSLISLNDFSYTPSYTPEAFAAAEEFLLSAKNWKGTANFARVFDDGRVYKFLTQACHAAMASVVKHTDGSTPSLIATEALRDCSIRNNDYLPNHISPRSLGGVKKAARKDGVVDGFFNWLINESIFGRFILNKDSPSIHNGFIFSTDLPAALTQTLCIFSRHFYELLDRSFIKFDELVAAGVPKSVAYVTAVNCYYSYSYQPREENAVYVPLPGHRVFGFPEEIETLINFIQGKCNSSVLKNSYRTSPSIYGTVDLFLAVGGNKHPSKPFTSNLLLRDTELRDFLKELRGEATGSLPEIVNPFKRTTSGAKDPLAVANNEMFEIIKFLSARGDFKNAVH